MDTSLLKNEKKRKKRAMRVRRKLRGTAQKPRLCVIKTNKHLFLQMIDDDEGKTLASISTISKEFKDKSPLSKSQESAKILGTKIAELAKKQNIEAVIFDRGRSKYHGLTAAVADGAREAGLKL